MTPDPDRRRLDRPASADGSRVAVLALVLALLLVPSLAHGTVARPALPAGPLQTGPTADLTVTPNPANPGDVVALDATNSSTPNGSIASCEFDVNGDGTYTETSRECLLETSYDTVGEYQPSVRVTTTNDEIVTDSVNLTVAENDPPTAVIEVDPATPGVGAAVTLSGAASTDADGQITTYTWELPSGRLSGESVETSFDEPGEYAVSLTVVDDDGAANSTTETVSVEERNEPPTARLSVVGAEPTVGEPVDLDASESVDPDGTIAAYAWDFDGDGSVDRTTDEPATAYVPETAGTTAIAVTVIDDGGAADTTTVEFTVAEVTTDAAEPAPTRGTATPTATPATAPGPGWADRLDLGVLPFAPDLLAALLLLLVLVGSLTAVSSQRRKAVAEKADRLRDLVVRGDVRRKLADKVSGATVKTVAKKSIRKFSDLIEWGGKGVGEAFERVGQSIKRGSERVAAWLRRLGT